MLLNQLKEITGIQDAAFLRAALKVCACCHCSAERRPLSLSRKPGESRLSQNAVHGSDVGWRVCGLVPSWSSKTAGGTACESDAACAVRGNLAHVGGGG